jgi:hypothetical protein
MNKETLAKKLRGKYPWEFQIKSFAKKDGREKLAFKKHEIFEVIYTAFLLRIITTTISIAKELSENDYREIEKANATIRQIKAEYEKHAIMLARKMTNAQQATNQANRYSSAHQALYVQARNAYEALRAEVKQKMVHQLNKIKLHQTEIELCADRELAYADELIKLYWETAKRIYTILPPDPPSTGILIKIAEIGMPEPLPEDTSLPNVEEYLRHEAVFSLPRQYDNQSQLTAAGYAPVPQAITGIPCMNICPQCNTESPQSKS